MADVILHVHFLGGPFDGLDQGWNVNSEELPETLRMSIELAQSRGGMRMDVTSPEACGVLRDGELAKDEVVYRQRDPGRYYYDPLGDDFEVIPAGSA